MIQRGNNRDVVIRSEVDYGGYLDKLEECCRRFDCDLHAYVLMTSHVHLLMTRNSGDGIGKVMQSLGRSYVGYLNARYGRTGTRWEGRYRATLIDSEEYLLTCMRYIELNPVRAGTATRPGDYPYSSYGGNALGAKDPLLRPHDLYRRLGATPAETRRAYRALVRARLSQATLEEIREATNKAWALGDRRFKAKAQRLTGRRAQGERRRPEVRGIPREREFQSSLTLLTFICENQSSLTPLIL